MPKVHYTKRYKRVRIKDPKLFDKRSLRVKKVPGRPDVKIIVGCPKGKYNPRSKRCKLGIRLQAKLYKR